MRTSKLRPSAAMMRPNFACFIAVIRRMTALADIMMKAEYRITNACRWVLGIEKGKIKNKSIFSYALP